MIRALIITVVLIIPSITVAGDIYTEYIWGTDISKIKKQYEIGRFDNEILSSNLKRFFSPSFRTNFSQYLTVKQFDFSHKGYKFTRVFGFHKDKLIYTFLFTDELPLPPDFKHTQLVQYKSLLGSITPDGWGMILRDEPNSGNIFLESAVTAHATTASTIIELHICVGTLSKPEHLQFVIFEFDRDFFEKLSASNDYKVPDAVKKVFPSHRMFTKYVRDKDFKKLLD